jgi:hypothetical protein
MTIEEILEMLGVVMFIHTLLSYLNQHHGVREMMIHLPVRQRYDNTQPENQYKKV